MPPPPRRAVSARVPAFSDDSDNADELTPMMSGTAARAIAEHDHDEPSPKPEAGASSVNAAEKPDSESDAVTCCCCVTLSSRIWYAVLLVFGFIIAIIYRNGFFGILDRVSGFNTCAGNPSCYNILGVFRISFALAVFFFVHVLIHIPCGKVMRHVQLFLQTSLWFVKIPALVGLAVGTMFIANNVFEAYGYVALVLSALFMLVQLVILIDFACSWNDKWVANDADGERPVWRWLLLLSSGALYAAGIAIVVLNFLWFTRDADDACTMNKVFVSLVLGLGAITTTVALILPHGSLLPAAVVFFYSAQTTWSALYNQPIGHCNEINGSESNQIWQIVLQTMFAAVMTAYTIFNTAKSDRAFEMDLQKYRARERPPQKNFFFFHIVMTLGSAYIAMVLTGWSLNNLTTSTLDEAARSSAAVWAKISTVWACNALYLWTLVAPLIFKNREFG